MSLDGRYFDMDGEPITLMEWAQLYETTGARHIGSDERDGIHVSTVLLGLNHNYGDGPPLIFETMIFGGDHDQYQKRYSTKKQAEAGHKRALALAFGKVPA